VKPLAHWLKDARELGEEAYRTKHPYPLLVHATSGYKLRPIEKIAMTIDRAVLAPSKRPATAPTVMDEYLALPVVALQGGRVFDLSVGSHVDSDLWIDDVTVSATHAHMTRDKEGLWYLQDASSTTGTHVNDRDPDPTQALVAGDRISIGMVDFTFYPAAEAYRFIRRLVGG
jgi:hypothetical protein